MSKKEITLHLIKQRGDCTNPIDIACPECPHYNTHLKGATHCIPEFMVKEDSLNGSRSSVYAESIKFFLKNFGTEEDLVELLL